MTMTPGECFREAAEIAMAERRGLDANKAAWSNNPILTPDREYIDDWERRAEEGEYIAKALLARAAEEDSRAQPEAEALVDELNEAFSEGQEARFERLCQENGRTIINALRGKGK